MPIKIRSAKGRRPLDGEEIYDHFYGPGTALLSGLGYCSAVAGNPLWQELSEEDRDRVRAAMRVDWERHGAAIMRAWDERDDHAIFIAEGHHGAPEQPWSATAFGGL